MIVKGKKVVKIEEPERQKLREALKIVVELLDEVDEEQIRYAKEDLETLIYTDEWEIDF